MSKKATIQDLAAHTQLSVATISRVLNNEPSVTPKTKAKVQKGIAELGYIPNILGRNLRKEKTNTLYVLLPSIENQFYSEIVRGIEVEANLNGYKVLLCEVYDDLKRYLNFASDIKMRVSDGVILISPGLPEAIPYFDDIPLVICCETDPAYKRIQIDIDNERGAFDAVNHLIQTGRRKIAFLGGEYKPDEYRSSILRRQGYLAALEAGGIPYDPKLMISNCYEYSEGLKAMSNFIASGQEFDAVFAVSDILATSTVNAVFKAGLSVPGDVAVIGFDDIPFAQFQLPQLSSIRQPCREMGKNAFKLLYSQLNQENEETDKIVYLQHELVVRGSTAEERTK